MLELFAFLFLSIDSQNFFAQQKTPEPIGLEILNPAKIPYKNDGKIQPVLLQDQSTAIWAIDMGTGKILYEKNAHRTQNIASISKLMTALIILENHDMNEVVVFPEEAFIAIGSRADFYLYEKVTVKTLLETMMVASANDSAIALAIHHAGSEADFVKIMNTRAKELGLTSATFYGATGLDIFEKPETYDPLTGKFEGKVYGNEMSASDIAKLSKFVYAYPFIQQTAQKTEIQAFSADEAFFREKDNTNQLLGTFLNVKGLKTGYTVLAQECVVTIGETVDGNDVMIVVLGSSDRFGETKKLLSWIYDSYTWK